MTLLAANVFKKLKANFCYFFYVERAEIQAIIWDSVKFCERQVMKLRQSVNNCKKIVMEEVIY